MKICFKKLAFRFVVSTLTTLVLSVFPTVMFAEPTTQKLLNSLTLSAPLPPPPSINGEIAYRTTFADPDSNNDNWRLGSVTGNGENALIESGNPISDAMIFQNIKFNFPNSKSREVPKLSQTMDAARQTVFKNGYPMPIWMDAGSSWLKNTAGIDEQWTIRNTYGFHPAHQLRLTMESSYYDDNSYLGYTKYKTAEIGTTWTDTSGNRWERKSFTSREDNVTITSLKSLDGAKINMDLNVDNITSMRDEKDASSTDLFAMRYKKVVDTENASYIGEIAHYPNYALSELCNAGFGGITRVIAKGGAQKYVNSYATVTGDEAKINIGADKNPIIRISNADEVILISKSDRDLNMGALSAFADATNYALQDTLVKDTLDVASKYGSNDFNYDKALVPHAQKHGEMFDRVKLDLGGSKETRELTNEQLIQAQRNSTNTLLPAILERMFYNGRYANVCSSGIQVPRLGGIWTGAWRVQWSGDYTTDANINLQVAGNNIGAMPETSQGFTSLMLKSIVDWQINAKSFYDIDNALFAPSRTDGDRATMFHWGTFEGLAWNSGASWLILPISEYWQCYGNQSVPVTDELRVKLMNTGSEYKYRDIDFPDDKKNYNLRNVLDLTQNDVDRILSDGYFDLESDILYPLLEKTCNFWEGFLTPQYYVNTKGEAAYDANHTILAPGEKYLILPSYSPENIPQNANPVTMNATMDISSTKESINALIALDKKLKDGANVAKWQQLYDNLPEYVYEPTGELKEWALKQYTENYNHRHLSHLYGTWPSYEANKDVKVFNGSLKALQTKIKSLGIQGLESFGWVYRGLVAARLKNPQLVKDSLMPIFTGTMIYPSLMTACNVDGSKAYCTDASITIPTVVLESLVYSDDGQVELLPALIKESQISGSVSGIKTRSLGEIKTLAWNSEKVTAVIDAPVATRLKLSGNIPYTKVTVNGIDVTNQLENDPTDFRGLKFITICGNNITVEYDMPKIATGIYSISNVSGGLTVNDLAKDAAVDVVAMQSPISDAQAWRIEYSTELQAYIIKSITTGRALTDNNSLLRQSPFTGTDNQLWTFVDGKFTSKTGHILDGFNVERIDERAIRYIADEIIISAPENSVNVKSRLNFCIAYTPGETSEIGVNWRVIPGTGKAYISANGTLIGESEGTVTVYAEAKVGGAVSNAVEVMVNPRTDVEIEGMLLSSDTFDGGSTNSRLIPHNNRGTSVPGWALSTTTNLSYQPTYQSTSKTNSYNGDKMITMGLNEQTSYVDAKLFYNNSAMMDKLTNAKTYLAFDIQPGVADSTNVGTQGVTLKGALGNSISFQFDGPNGKIVRNVEGTTTAWSYVTGLDFKQSNASRPWLRFELTIDAQNNKLYTTITNLTTGMTLKTNDMCALANPAPAYYLFSISNKNADGTTAKINFDNFTFLPYSQAFPGATINETFDMGTINAPLFTSSNINGSANGFEGWYFNAANNTNSRPVYKERTDSYEGDKYAYINMPSSTYAVPALRFCNKANAADYANKVYFACDLQPVINTDSAAGGLINLYFGDTNDKGKFPISFDAGNGLLQVNGANVNQQGDDFKTNAYWYRYEVIVDVATKKATYTLENLTTNKTYAENTVINNYSADTFANLATMTIIYRNRNATNPQYLGLDNVIFAPYYRVFPQMSENSFVINDSITDLEIGDGKITPATNTLNITSNITNNTGSAAPFTFISASYSEAGKLIDVKTYSLPSLEVGVPKNFAETGLNIAGASFIKTFYFDNFKNIKHDKNIKNKFISIVRKP